MAISPLGAVIYTNQNVTAAAAKQTSVQNRIEMQSLMASALTNEKEEVVAQVRPTEETHKIDPEKEHEKQKKEQEDSLKEGKVTKNEEDEDDEESKNSAPSSRLDITV